MLKAHVQAHHCKRGMRTQRIPLLLYIAKNHWQKTLSNARENTPTTPDELPSSGISASPNRSHRFAAASSATIGRESTICHAFQEDLMVNA